MPWQPSPALPEQLILLVSFVSKYRTGSQRRMHYICTCNSTIVSTEGPVVFVIYSLCCHTAYGWHAHVLVMHMCMTAVYIWEVCEVKLQVLGTRLLLPADIHDIATRSLFSIIVADCI